MRWAYHEALEYDSAPNNAFVFELSSEHNHEDKDRDILRRHHLLLNRLITENTVLSVVSYFHTHR